MFSLNENNHFYLYTQCADLRKGFNMLMGMIRTRSNLNPIDGSVYLFVNRQRTTMKLFSLGAWRIVIYHKRLECGRISSIIFKSGDTFRPLRWDELVLLIEGINPNTKRRKRYNK